ncbi:MAG: hypothetical protein AB199_01375 [Parcubacteria bacterium C7867-004]|nr:MAG: hypothetical protein AB199_01375 [Parcubacteria bacterium C7867-004]
MSLEEVGHAIGGTRQAAHYTYNRWFKIHLGPRMEMLCQRLRLRAIAVREAELRKELDAANSDSLSIHLIEEAARHSKTLVPVIDYEGIPITRGPHLAYRIGDRYIRAYSRESEIRPTDGQRYAAFHISTGMLPGIYACIFVVNIPGLPKETFVVRASVIRKLYGGDIEYPRFYVSVGDYHPKMRKTTFNLRKFKDAWWIFDL